jgi:hypothetical protein
MLTKISLSCLLINLLKETPETALKEPMTIVDNKNIIR